MKRCAGFSLIELSIVLVILGLLTGGILAGRSLIHAAELRKTGQDIAGYRTAIYGFRDKYFGLPGDITNATAFWGAADGGDGLGADCYVANNNDGTTCNGDGDGKVSATYVSGPESYRLWQQLANAGLIAGTYSGASGSAAALPSYIDDLVGTNLPRSTSNPKAGYVISYFWWNYGYTTSVSMRKANTLAIGGAKNLTTKAIEGPAFTPDDTWNLDTKLDDGLPGKGIFQIFGNWTGCASTATDYVLTNPIIKCQPVITIE